MNFFEKLRRISKKNNSIICVGLDVDKEKIPPHLLKASSSPLLDFNKKIIDVTCDLTCAYKLNLAFYEQYGIDGFQLLTDTLGYIPNDIVVILDGKRNDIGNTAAKYAKALFEIFNADAVTLSPYLGKDSIAPFLKYTNRQSFILCRTSNTSAGDFQDLQTGNKPLYEHVAQKIVDWNEHKNCGAVVGATYPEELKKIRNILGDDIPLLIPGVGTQGGDVKKTVEFGTNSKGELAIINSSRGILYKDSSRQYAASARSEAQQLRDEINSYRILKT
jgi:orotidine-5'-phosphate decarboxylase